MEEFGGGIYLQIPLVHANQNCLVREGDPVSGELRTRVAYNCAYVPLDAFYDDLESHILTGRNDVVSALEKSVKISLNEENKCILDRKTEEIHERIRDLKELHQTAKLYKERRYPEEVRIILKAVKLAPNEIAQLNSWITAAEIYGAVRWFCKQPCEGTDNDIYEYEQRTAGEMDSKRSVAITLGKYIKDESQGDSDGTKYVQKRKVNEQRNEWKLSYSRWGNVKELNVTGIEDIMELPCMENVHKHLQEEKPVRWILYSLVRVIYSTKPEVADKEEFTVEDIVEWFDPSQEPGSGYPWFDEETTRYQAGYEKVTTPDDSDEPALPISCNNDNQNFSQFCIGQENCDYSIYRSLPFFEDVYERLPDNDGI